MFGDACCTFIPNNTAPDGSITKALEGLISLSLELAENSGSSDPFSDLMGKWSGQWKDTITSVIIAIGIMLTILVLFGYCLIPCFRALVLRAIEYAVEKRDIMYSALPAEEEDYAQPTAPAYDDEVSLHLFDSDSFNE